MIDFHNHHPDLPQDWLSIRSFHQQESALFETWTKPCSVGLHPWFIAESTSIRDEQMYWLANVANAEKVKLIGECGLDKISGLDLGIQQVVFEFCLQLAGQLQKPLVIHCVRAYTELLESVDKIQPNIPLILHGFARKPSLLAPLLKRGFFISFGAAILIPNSAAANSLIQTPLEQLFLETDDKLLPITDLYTCAAQLKGISVEDLVALLQHNWKRITDLKK